MSSFSSHEGNEKFFISPTSSFPSLKIPLFLYLFASKKTHLLVLSFLFFIAIGSRSLLRVFLSLNFMSHPLEKSLLNSKKPIHAYHVRSPIFSKNFFIPILTLQKSSFPFQNSFSSIGIFSYKNVKLLN